MTPALLARFERALASGALVELVGELRAEGHEILACYRFLYGAFQTHLRAARRPEEVAALLAACETVQHALGATFDPILFARISPHLRAQSLRQLVVELHDHEGWSKRRLYDTLLAFSFALDAAGRGEETYIVDDELDVISGWCAASAILWPAEPLD